MSKRIIAFLLVSVFLVLTISSCGEMSGVGIGRQDVVDFDISEITEEVTTEPEKIHKVISFAGAGDNIIYKCAFVDAQQNPAPGREYDFSSYYTRIKDKISQADVSFVNQETLMAGTEYGYSDYPRFNSPRDLATDLYDVGFDIVSIANNHMLDMGTSGIEDTISFYKSINDKFTMIGGYENKEDFLTPRVIEVEGIKIALVAFTYSTNGITLSENSDVYIPYINKEDIAAYVEKAKEAADLVFVSMHWGEENNNVPTDDQRDIAKYCADLGVDVIIGQHPHVIQPIEWIEGKDGHKMLCIFSLGDFIAVMMSPYNMLGGIVTFNIVQDDETFTIEDPMFNPTVFNYGPTYYNGSIYWLEDYPEDLAASLGQVYGANSSKEKLVNYVKDTISSEFLPEYLHDAPETTADTATADSTNSD